MKRSRSHQQQQQQRQIPRIMSIPTSIIIIILTTTTTTVGGFIFRPLTTTLHHHHHRSLATTTFKRQDHCLTLPSSFTVEHVAAATDDELTTTASESSSLHYRDVSHKRDDELLTQSVTKSNDRAKTSTTTRSITTTTTDESTDTEIWYTWLKKLRKRGRIDDHVQNTPSTTESDVVVSQSFNNNSPVDSDDNRLKYWVNAQLHHLAQLRQGRHSRITPQQARDLLQTLNDIQWPHETTMDETTTASTEINDTNDIIDNLIVGDITKQHLLSSAHDHPRDAWYRQFTALLAYKKKYGNCLVPQIYPANPALGRWVSQQRYKSGRFMMERQQQQQCHEENDDDSNVIPERSLQEKRLSLLESVGFVWSTSRGRRTMRRSWEGRMEELRRYKETHGDLDIPQKHGSLGRWVNNQRTDYIKNRQGLPSSLSDERITALEQLGFSWSIPNKTISEWHDHYQRLELYYVLNGHCQVVVSPTNNDTTELAQWVTEQRRRYHRYHKHPEHLRPNTITMERVRLLNRLDFDWGPMTMSWEDRYEELVEFKERYGHTLVPQDYEDNPALGRWVNRQRTERKWMMELTNDDHDDEDEDDEQQPQKRRRLRRTSSMTTQRLQKLNNIGFSWTVDDCRWMQRFDELRQFQKEHGHTCVPSLYDKNKSLGKWVTRQRMHYRRGCLMESRRRMLEDLGFVWSVYNVD